MENIRSHNWSLLAGVLLVIFSVVARFVFYPLMTNDYTDSLVPWFNTLKDNPALSAFQYPFSNYTPIYLYFLKLLTFLPISSLYTIKTVSVIFDAIIAWTIYKIIKEVRGNAYSREQYFLIFSIAFAIPTMLINSSLWAQCDSIYTAFALLSLYFIFRDKPVAASFMMALSICFKLQAIFFLPVFLGYIVTKPKKILHILILPAVYIVSIIPAVLGGGSFWDLLTVYFRQTTQYEALSLSAPSIYAFLGGISLGNSVEQTLSLLGIIAGIVIFGILVWHMIRQIRIDNFTAENLLLISLLSVIALPFVLPHMHERYFYLADVFSVLYALYDPKRWYVAVLIVASSLFSYMPFISVREPIFSSLIVNEVTLAVFMLLALVIVATRTVGARYAIIKT